MPDGTQETGRVFGIDLGTTYSAIAYIDETGARRCAATDEQQRDMPSVVYFETPTTRWSARRPSSRRSGPAQRRVADQAEDGVDGSPPTRARTTRRRSISALVLRQLAADAAAYTSGPVERWSSPSPPTSASAEKKATENAGHIAGLDVVGILPEPVAAAIHYDLTSGGGDKTVLIYDLGGGTFDTTVIKVSAGEIDVVCTDGDTNLGGADWDGRLTGHLLGRFTELANPSESPDDDPEFVQEVVTKAEEVKKQLASSSPGPCSCGSPGPRPRSRSPGPSSRQMTADLLDRSVEIVSGRWPRCRRSSPGRTIDEVLLVGGSTKMPMVAERLTEEFGWTPEAARPRPGGREGRGTLRAVPGGLPHAAGGQREAETEAEGDGGPRRSSRRSPSSTASPHANGRPEKALVSVLPKAFGVSPRQRTTRPGNASSCTTSRSPTTRCRSGPAGPGADDPHRSDRASRSRSTSRRAPRQRGALGEHAADQRSRDHHRHPGPAARRVRRGRHRHGDRRGRAAGLEAEEQSTGARTQLRVRVGMSEQELDEAVGAISKIAVSG